MFKSTQHPNKKKISAQAMVEFALALPVLLLVVYGLLETGRLLFIYASVVTAARNAARYGSASGDIGNGTLYYNDCAGIRAAANKVAFIQRFNTPIDIQYDLGPKNPNNIGTGCPVTDNAHPLTDNEHRIKVTVSADFRPIVPLVPLRPFTITSTSDRTILTGVSIAVDSAAVIVPGGGGQLTLLKTANPSSFTGPGQTITYTYVITDPGSDPIVNIILTDDKVTPSCPGGMNFSLAGNNDSKTCTATYLTNQGDVDAGQPIVNHATATGFNTGGTAVTATSQATVNFIGTPKLQLTKTGVAPSLMEAGQQIKYTFALENQGNVALTSFAISDGTISSWSCSGATSPLKAGDSTQCTGSYSLKQADLNRGYVDNTATATAKWGAVSVTSNSSSAHVLTPDLLLEVTADKLSVTSVPTTITFTYTLTNRTGAGMTNITITDTHGANNYPCVASLAAGKSDSCTRTYTITQADMDTGSAFVETATGSGVQGSTTITSNQGGVTIQMVRSPVLTLAKGANPSTAAPALQFNLGQIITYSYTLQNTGNVTLSAPFVVTDDHLGAVCTVSSGTLAPGAYLPPGSPTSPSCTMTYALQQPDLDAGSVINKATATGTLSGQTITSAQATATVITYTAARMALVKTANVDFFTAANQTINYTYTLKNTGGLPLAVSNPYTLFDDKIGTLTCGVVGTLQLGGSAICTTHNYTTTAGDVAAKGVTNTVNVVTGSTTNPPTTAPTAKLSIPLFVCDSSTVKGNGPIASGSSVDWTITNSSGLPIHIASVTITWSSNNAKLQEVRLNNVSIWSGSANTGIVLPGAPWTLNKGANVMNLNFNNSTSGIRVQVGFAEASCNLFLDSNAP